MGRRSGWLDSRGEREWSSSDMMENAFSSSIFFYSFLTNFKKMEHVIVAHGKVSKGTKDIQ